MDPQHWFGFWLQVFIDFSGCAESPAVAGQKRKAPHHFAELFTPPLGKKAKKNTGGGPQLPKNACVALNEYKPGLEYVLVEQRGETVRQFT
jgi:hypothetical protein